MTRRFATRKLRFGDLGLVDADMLIGADFFLSHRIYVASKQRKVYFTFNGGPVFNLADAPPQVAGTDRRAKAAPRADEPAAPHGRSSRRSWQWRRGSRPMPRASVGGARRSPPGAISSTRSKI